MKDFAAIDFETANRERSSVCSVGAVIVRDGRIVDSIYRLIRPRPHYYSSFCTRIHGLTAADTAAAPEFPAVWREVAERIGSLPLVAHNKAFDEKCIRAAFRTYGMDYPDYTFLCTVQKARRTIPRSLCPSFSLPYLCDFLGIPFCNHHNALADAEACAKIAMAIL